MNQRSYVYLALGLLFLAAPAGAAGVLIPDTIAIDTDTEWVTAGSRDGATLTVQFISSTSDETSFEGEFAVDFTVSSTAYGTIAPTHVTMKSTEMKTVDFKPGTISGDVTITATATSRDPDVTLKNITVLHIDHAVPNQINKTWYSPKVTAGGETKIIVRMEDQHKNVVDNRREMDLSIPSTETDNATFTVGSSGGGAEFIGSTDKITVPVDENGNVTATLRVDRLAGENIVWIQPPAPVRGQYITIRGAADGVPVSITCNVTPAGALVPANKKDKITLMYELTDAYGNPAGGQDLWVNSSGLQVQSKLVNSSSRGEVWVTYGPEETVGIVTITATAVLNPDVTNTTRVEFTSTEPVDMLLSASPQTMASRDRNPDVVSELRAKVMDVKGNPVVGETVKFEIVSNRSAPYNQTVDQVLEMGAAITNSDGSAIVRFHPGAFTNDRKAPGWDAAASGNAIVRATWENVTRGCHVTRDITLTWMNYPYLSVETEVSHAAVSVNSTDGVSNTTDVTIRVKGDGYAMQPDPIDVVLCTDRSGSMLYDNPDRMHSVREAAKRFVDSISESDRVGLVTFGRNTGSNSQINTPGENSFGRNAEDYINNIYETPKQYLNYATVDQSLTNSFSSVKVKLDNIVPDYGTPMRAGLYKSIKELCGSGSSTPNSGAIKAVILLSDGDYNWYGDPLARGTGYVPSEYGPTQYSDLDEDYYVFDGLSNDEQNLSVYARHKDVTIYSIGYADSISTEGRATLETLAKSTGGKYYNGTAANIGAVYTDIAGELKTDAGVNTMMTVFKNVEVDGTPRSAADVFDYVYKYNESTTIESWIKNGTGNHTIIPLTPIDQTDAWKRDKQLHFDIGTIRLNQTWVTTFRVAVKTSYAAGEDNNINLFGDGAIISFNNGEEKLPLPDTFITIFPDLASTGVTLPSLVVGLTEPESDSGPFVDLVPLTWNTTYNGTKGVDVSLAHSRYEDMRSPTTFFTQTLDYGIFMTGDNTTTNSTQMDVRDLAPGKYWVTVTASARDARTAENTTFIWVHTRDPSRSHIKIE